MANKPENTAVPDVVLEVERLRIKTAALEGHIASLESKIVHYKTKASEEAERSKKLYDELAKFRTAELKRMQQLVLAIAAGSKRIGTDDED